MKQKITNILLIAAFFITGFVMQAQTYPVQVIPQVTPPPPVYLTEYSNAGSINGKVKLNLLLTDLTVSNRAVKLKLYIEGNGIKAQSKDFVVGAQQLFLDGGVLLSLGSAELAPYFELQNLQGISAGAYANALPEGLYQYCFEVYDVISGNKISSKSCTNVLIFLNEPPLLNVPFNNVNLEAMNPQNLLFQWTPRHVNVSNVVYEFSLVEIWDNTMDPQAVFLASPPFYQVTTNNTNLLYGVAEPPLLEGKRYAWRVQAKAIDGVDEIGVFANNGYSEIFTFTYQGDCAEPTNLTVEEVGTKTATYKWQGDIDNLNYKVAYRKAQDENGNTGDANTNTWFESDTNREEFIVIDLEPNTAYEWRVGGFCADGTLTYAQPKIFTTMAKEAEAYYNCGIEPSIDITNQTLLETLQVGDVIKAGDFNVKIKEVSGSNTFTGKGYTTVGFLKNIKIALEFTDIQVNTDYKFVNGIIKTVYDPNWGNILDVDAIIDRFEDVADVVAGDDNHNILLDYEITRNDISLNTTGGQIIIKEPNGDSHEYDYDEGDVYTINDASGDEFQIDRNGRVTQTGVGAEGGPATAENTIGISSGHRGTALDPMVRDIPNNGILITFEKNANSKYGLDNADNEYEKANYPSVTIDGGSKYYPAHKAVVAGTTDTFTATITGSNTNIDLDNLIFKTVRGKKIETIKQGNTYKVTVKADSYYKNEEAIITYKNTDSTQTVLGSFFINQLKNLPKIPVNVVLVNGATKVDRLESEVNKIYKQPGVEFTIKYVDPIEIDASVWDVENVNQQIDLTENNFWQGAIPDELKAIKGYYKANNTIDPNAYYLFILGKKIKVSNKDAMGIMRPSSQWGYLFEDNYTIKRKDPSVIAAHELGHGLFRLEHPFGKDKNKIGTIYKTWLMDYDFQTELPFLHWAQISSDKLHLFDFSSTSDSQQATVSNIELLRPLANDNGSFTFISLAGKPITLPANTSSVTFSTGDDLNLKNCDDKFKIEPFGSLRSFIIENKEYTFCASCNGQYFGGYFEKGQCDSAKKYIDTLSNEQNKNAIVGLPCVKNDAVIFKAMLSSNYFQSFDFSSITSTYGGEGDLKPYDFIISEFNNIPDERIIYLPAKLDPKFDDDVINFLSSEFCNCDENDLTSVAYGFVYATQLQKNKEYLGCFKTGVPLFFYDENINTTKFHYAVVNEWQEKNINGFNTLKNNIEKFKNLKTTFSKITNVYALEDFLKYYVPEYISKSNVNSYKLRFGITKWETGLVLDKIQNITNNQLQNQFDDVFCLWENISFEDRIYALNHISKYNRLDDMSEEILLYLIINESNTQLIINELKKENYKLFWKVWDELDAEQKGVLVSYLNSNIINDAIKQNGKDSYESYRQKCEKAIGADCDLNDYKILPLWRANALDVVDFNFDLGPGGLTYEIDYSLETSHKDGGVHIEASTNTIDFSRLDNYWPYFFTDGNSLFNSIVDPFTPITLVVREDIKLNDQIILKKDELAVVPAIFLHWLDSSIDSEQNQVIIRVAADGLIVASIIASGGATTPMLALDLAVFGTDFVFQIANESSDSINPEIEEVWNSIYNLYNVANIPRAVVSSVAAGKSFITFVKNSSTASRWNKMVVKPEFIDDYVNQLKNLPEAERTAKIASEITLLDNVIIAIKNTPRLSSTAYIPKSLYRNLINARLKLANVQFNTSGITMGVEASVNSFTPYLMVNSSGNSVALANIISTTNSTSKLSLESIRWLPTSISINSIRTIGSINNIEYLNVNGVSKIGKLEIVEDVNNLGQFYANLANTRSELIKLTTILQKPEFTTIFNKLKSLPTTPSRTLRYASKDALRDEFIRLHDLNTTGVKSLDNVLDDFDDLISNHSNVVDIEKYVDELLQSPSKFKGGAYGLEILNDLPPSLQGKTLSRFEASIDDLEDAISGCRFDLQFSDGVKLVYVETKNYAKTTSFTSSFYNQFKSYISAPNITSIDDIKYFFRANENITKAERVKKFKSMLLKENRYETIFNSNKELFESLNLNEKQFYNLLKSNNESHSFFNFIEIY